MSTPSPKTWFITGASSGFGMAFAEFALERGDHVVATARSVSKLEALCTEFDVPLRAAALQFPLAHPSVTSVVAGCANGAEARDCAAMFSHPIPVAFWHALRDRGLVDARAPVPA